MFCLSFGVMPSLTMKVSVLSLGLLPLTLVRHFPLRLWTGLIFKRGMAYTLCRRHRRLYFAGVASISGRLRAHAVPQFRPTAS